MATSTPPSPARGRDARRPPCCSRPASSAPSTGPWSARPARARGEASGDEAHDAWFAAEDSSHTARERETRDAELTLRACAAAARAVDGSLLIDEVLAECVRVAAAALRAHARESAESEAVFARMRKRRHVRAGSVIHLTAADQRNIARAAHRGADRARRTLVDALRATLPCPTAEQLRAAYAR